MSKVIASQGEWAAESLAQNFDFDKLRLFAYPPLDLYKLMASQAATAAEILAENFDKLGLEKANTTELLELYELMASQSSIAAEILAENFNKLGLEKANLASILNLCKFIASHEGGFTEETLVRNFDKLGLLEIVSHCKGLQKRLKVCNDIASQDEWAERALIENFDKLGIVELVKGYEGLKERLNACKFIASQGGWAAAGLFQNFYKLGLENTNLTNLLELSKIGTSQGERAAVTFWDNFDNILGLEQANSKDLLKNLTDLADLCNITGSKAPYLAHQRLTKEFNKFRILEIVNRYAGELQDRLKASHLIVSRGEWVAMAFTENFDKLRLEKADLSDLLNLYRGIAMQGDNAANALTKHFGKLRLEKADLSDLLDLYKLIASQGKWAAMGLVKNFDKLGLEKANPTDLLELFKLIASQGELAAEYLAGHLDKLSLENATHSDLFDLSKCIVSQGENAAKTLTENFDKLGLEKANLTDLLELFKLIASQGELAAEALTRHLDKLSLENATHSDLFDLSKCIVSQGENAAKNLTENFDKLGLEKKLLASNKFNKKAVLSDYIDLYKLIASQGEKAAVALAKNFDSLSLQIANLFPNSGIERQILIELITYPNFVQNLPKDFVFPEVFSSLKPLLIKNEDATIDTAELEQFEMFLKNEKINFLHPLFENAKKEKNQRVKLALTQFLAYTAAVLHDLSKDSNKAIADSKVIEDILSYRNPPHRLALVRELSLINNLKTLPRGPKSKRLARLSFMPLERLKQIDFLSEESKISLFKKIQDIQGFKDGKQFAKLTNLLLQLLNDRPYKNQESKAIAEKLEEILSKSKRPKTREKIIDQISRDLQIMTNIQKIFGKQELVNALKPKSGESEESEKDLSAIFKEKFASLFEVEETENLADDYQKTFGKFRDETALFNYFRTIEKLPSSEKKTVKEALNRYVNAVLKETFFDVRYDIENSVHLRALFEKNSVLKSQWLTADDPKSLKERTDTPETPDYKKILKQKIVIDGHLKLEDFPTLVDYLQNRGEKLANPEGPKEHFQNLAIDLCEGKVEFKEFFDKLEKLKLPLGEFANDILAMKPKSTFTNLKISESDDPCDLLLIGTEIQGSCQRVNGDPQLNKCLLSYLLNGEIRPIVVKKGDKMVARSLLRLLIDSKNKTPVLLLERLYSNVATTAVEKDILDWAINKARKMGIPLISKEMGKGSRYDGNVEFMGGSAPFVYSDASGGVLSEHFYTEGCHRLYP